MEPDQTQLASRHLPQTDVIHSVVHDLRTPATVIKSHLCLLISGEMGELNADQKNLLQRSVGPLEEIIQLSENLLQSFSLQTRETELAITTVDLDTLLNDILHSYAFTFQQRGMRLWRDGNTLGARIRVDAFWFKRALYNLVWNAYKFTPDGGEVAFEVGHLDGGLTVSVRDTGRGIPAACLDKIFLKFEQATGKDREIGSGLGLWICRRVMELHGGRIWVESKEGAGSRFTLWLPSEKIL